MKKTSEKCRDYDGQQNERKVWQNTFKTWCTQDQYSVLIIVNLESNMCITSSPGYSQHGENKGTLKNMYFLPNCDNFHWSNELCFKQACHYSNNQGSWNETTFTEVDDFQLGLKCGAEDKSLVREWFI